MNFYFYIDGTFYQPDGSNSLVRPVGQISSPQERGNPQLSGTWESHKPWSKLLVAHSEKWKFPIFFKLTDFLLISAKLFVETDNFLSVFQLKNRHREAHLLLVSTFLFTLAITCRRVVGVRVLNTSSTFSFFFSVGGDNVLSIVIKVEEYEVCVWSELILDKLLSYFLFLEFIYSINSFFNKKYDFPTNKYYKKSSKNVKSHHRHDTLVFE